MFLLPFIIIAPLLSFIILIAKRDRLSFQQATFIGLGSSFVSAVVFIIAAASYFSNYGVGSVVAIHIFDAIKLGDFNPSIGLYIDGLSLMLIGIVTWVGFLVQLFATWSMQKERQFCNIFAYLNLLLVSLLSLVLADNLFLFYVGWEGVAMSSYLLYSYYMPLAQQKVLISKSAVSGKKTIDEINIVTPIKTDGLQKTNKSLLKMMAMTRIADIAVLLGLLLLYRELNTLDIPTIIKKAEQVFQVNDSHLVLIVSLFVIGALIKSAQIPLHTWSTGLSSVHMPAPVLAILHSLGLLAGVYLMARLHPLFILTPNILLWWVGTVGAISTVLAALCALMQTDIKRIIAFASITQMGFVFLAMGVGAWQLAVFQMMTFTLTQALLFLAVGAVLISISENNKVSHANILKMGGLKNSNPLVFYSFLIGVGSLNAIPVITLGYYSKLGILWETYISSPFGNHLLLVITLIGVMLTALYSYRLLWFVFFNSSHSDSEIRPLTGLAYQIPLGLLILLTSFVGFLLSPNITGILTDTFPNSVGETIAMTDGMSGRYVIIAMALGSTLIGVALAWLAYAKNKGIFTHNFKRAVIGKPVYYWCYHGLGFNALYDWLLLKPMLFIAKLINRSKIALLLLSSIGKSPSALLITPKNITSFDGYLFGFIFGLIVVLVLGLLTSM